MAEALTVAVIVMVTEAPAAMEPFQVTVLVPVFATAVPLEAAAATSVSWDGRVSVNSLPGLSPWAPVPLLVRTMV